MGRGQKEWKGAAAYKDIRVHNVHNQEVHASIALHFGYYPMCRADKTTNRGETDERLEGGSLFFFSFFFFINTAKSFHTFSDLGNCKKSLTAGIDKHSTRVYVFKVRTLQCY